MKRVALLGLYHECNTFAVRATGEQDFRGYIWCEGRQVVERYRHSHHEIGGILEVLDGASAIQVVPVLYAEAMVANAITVEAELALGVALERGLDEAGPIDGVMAVVHGAAVGQTQRDFDGWWLGELRRRLGQHVPMVCTLDPHANVSPAMVRAMDAAVAYRTNPHVDQRDTGVRAARLLEGMLLRGVRPAMGFAAPPMALDIERQRSDETPSRDWLAWGDRIAALPGVLSSSLCYGFPFADVAEMGTSVLVVTDASRIDAGDAQRLADRWANQIWRDRDRAKPRLVSVDLAVQRVVEAIRQRSVGDPIGPIGLLDMGDNVGGGAPADHTGLVHALLDAGVTRGFVALHDPVAFDLAVRVGPGQRLSAHAGGRHHPHLAGPPLRIDGRVTSITDGRWHDPTPQPDGQIDYRAGPIATVTTDVGWTVQLTQQRVFPVSLGQLTHAGLDPAAFDVLILKGVHAPVSAYGPVCTQLVRVDSPGPTAANLLRFKYSQRRRPMFPFETP